MIVSVVPLRLILARVNAQKLLPLVTSFPLASNTATCPSPAPETFTSTAPFASGANPFTLRTGFMPFRRAAASLAALAAAEASLAAVPMLSAAFWAVCAAAFAPDVAVATLESARFTSATSASQAFFWSGVTLSLGAGRPSGRNVAVYIVLLRVLPSSSAP